MAVNLSVALVVVLSSLDQCCDLRIFFCRCLSISFLACFFSISIHNYGHLYENETKDKSGIVLCSIVFNSSYVLICPISTLQMMRSYTALCQLHIFYRYSQSQSRRCVLTFIKRYKIITVFWNSKKIVNHQLIFQPLTRRNTYARSLRSVNSAQSSVILL